MSDEKVKQVIAEAAEAAAEKTAKKGTQSGSAGPNYFRAMEWLLWNYKKLRGLVERPEVYFENTFVQHHSKSITKMGSGGGTPGGLTSDAELEAAMLGEKEAAYSRTCARFAEVDAVVQLFREEADWPILGMYYLGEDAEGKEREAGAEPWTLEGIALELGVAARTVRRRRSRMVRNMSVALFGQAAAVSASVSPERYRGERENSEL